MSNRPEPLTAAQQVELGRVVLAMRDAGLCWKDIERQLRMGRTQLWRCRRRAEMQQQNRAMQHLGAGDHARAA